MRLRTTRVCRSNRGRSEIGVHPQIEHDRTGQLRRGRVAHVQLEALGKTGAAREEQRAVGTAANFSPGAWC